MSLMQQIVTDFESITQAEIDTMASRFLAKDPNDISLGAFSSYDAKRLLALSFRYNRQSALYLVDSYSGSKESMRLAQARSAEMDELGDITRDLAWLEIKRELGPAWIGLATLSVREGFEVAGTRASDEQEHPEMKFLGALNVTDIMRNAIMEMAKKSPGSPFRPKREEEKPS